MKILNKKQCVKFIELAVAKLADYIRQNKLQGIITGLSGGIDSSVVALIGKKAIDKLKKDRYKANYKYLYLDCQSDKSDFLKVQELCLKFNLNYSYYSLGQWYSSSPLLKEVPVKHPKTKIVLGNIKARLRMIYLYHFALLNNYVYLDTDDLSEEWMGFWTRHGDEGDLKIIQHITKSEVYDLGECFNLPKVIMNAKPGDGLGITDNNLASEQLGLDYIYIEYILGRFIGAGFDINGSFDQVLFPKFTKLSREVALEIRRPEGAIKKIISRTLKTAYKRKFGHYAADLLVDREEFGFGLIGSETLNKIYLKAVKIINHEN